MAKDDKRWYQTFQITADGEKQYSDPFRQTPERPFGRERQLNITRISTEVEQGVRFEVREIPAPSLREIEQLKPRKATGKRRDYTGR